jgi:Ala-tRNA(Pro) deacylase
MRGLDRLQAYLRAQGAPFRLQHHVVAYTSQEIAACEHVSPRMLAKVVIVLADGALAMLVLPASFRVDLERAASALGVMNARLAHEEEFAPSFPDCEVGAEPPFGNLYGVPVFVDWALTENEEIVFRAGTHTDTISLAYRDFARLVRPAVAELARPKVAHEI